MPVALCVTGIFLFSLAGTVFAHSGHNKKPEQPPQVLAPGYQSLNFTAPKAGSYTLPQLGPASDGNILDMQGKSVRLHQFFGDKYLVLSFIYTQCDDVNGCPLATYVSSQVQNRLAAEPLLRDKIRFISMSFDPANDTPAVMRDYAKNFVKKGFDWQFLTSTSESELDPLLAAYGQSILRDVDENGDTTGTISHILRVFLIDTDKQIRNIYNTSFLHPDTVVNDIKTLAMSAASKTTSGLSTPSPEPRLHGAGDYKQGYANKSYVTQAQSLQSRSGHEADLLQVISQTPLGLPAVPVPAENPLSKEKVRLGRQLFYDRRLSHNNTFSCAMCHIPEQGFTSNELATAVGVEGRTVRRNAPTIYNAVYAKRLFHDARETSLEQQIWGPLLAHNEMANPSVGQVISKINQIPDYRQQFEKVFKGQQADIKNVGDALASYQRVLVSANSDFDQWLFGKKNDAMNKDAIAGYRLFVGKAACVSCHLIEENHALFTDHKLHNTGVGYANSMSKVPVVQRVLVAPATWINVDTAAIADSAEVKPGDLGYYEISGLPEDRWKYRTPGLRNIQLTAPYMHDGSISTLEEVVEFYNTGGINNELLDPLLRPLHLSAKEKQQIVAFLSSLTGSNVDSLISDAFAAPVGNTR
ncbi:MAG: photosynthetic protein synthase I [Gammaproteobacteria bacterium]|nr:photosynthetic protein synthase I [Gammaproteobacteria bacterium]